MVNNLSQLVEHIKAATLEFEALTQLRIQRRADPNFKGCNFCFDTAWGELKDGTIVPCAEHNGLCL